METYLLSSHKYWLTETIPVLFSLTITLLPWTNMKSNHGVIVYIKTFLKVEKKLFLSFT